MVLRHLTRTTKKRDERLGSHAVSILEIIEQVGDEKTMQELMDQPWKAGSVWKAILSLHEELACSIQEINSQEEQDHTDWTEQMMRADDLGIKFERKLEQEGVQACVVQHDIVRDGPIGLHLNQARLPEDYAEIAAVKGAAIRLHGNMGEKLFPGMAVCAVGDFDGDGRSVEEMNEAVSAELRPLTLTCALVELSQQKSKEGDTVPEELCIQSVVNALQEQARGQEVELKHAWLEMQEGNDALQDHAAACFQIVQALGGEQHMRRFLPASTGGRSHPDDAKWESLFHGYDFDHNGTLDFDEVTALLADLLPEDTGGSWAGEDEHGHALPLVPEDADPLRIKGEARKMFQRMDADRNNMIDLSEFKAYVNADARLRWLLDQLYRTRKSEQDRKTKEKEVLDNELREEKAREKRKLEEETKHTSYFSHAKALLLGNEPNGELLPITIHDRDSPKKKKNPYSDSDEGDDLSKASHPNEAAKRALYEKRSHKRDGETAKQLQEELEEEERLYAEKEQANKQMHKQQMIKMKYELKQHGIGSNDDAYERRMRRIRTTTAENKARERKQREERRQRLDFDRWYRHQQQLQGEKDQGWYRSRHRAIEEDLAEGKKHFRLSPKNRKLTAGQENLCDHYQLVADERKASRGLDRYGNEVDHRPSRSLSPGTGEPQDKFYYENLEWQEGVFKSNAQLAEDLENDGYSLEPLSPEIWIDEEEKAMLEPRENGAEGDLAEHADHHGNRDEKTSDAAQIEVERQILAAHKAPAEASPGEAGAKVAPPHKFM